MEIVGQIVTAINDVGLVNGEDRISGIVRFGRSVPLNKDRNQAGSRFDGTLYCLESSLFLCWLHSPFTKPETAILPVEPDPVERSVQSISQVCIAVATPVRKSATDWQCVLQNRPEIRWESEA